MKSGLVALLSGTTAISDLVGSRVYVNKAKQGAALPHIVITQTDSQENQTLDSHVGVRFVDFDIDCKADRSVEAETLGNACRTLLENYTGTAGDQTVGAVVFQSESSHYESPDDGSDIGVHVILLDLTIQYTPA